MGIPVAKVVARNTRPILPRLARKHLANVRFLTRASSSRSTVFRYAEQESIDRSIDNISFVCSNEKKKKSNGDFLARGKIDGATVEKIEADESRESNYRAECDALVYNLTILTGAENVDPDERGP